MPDHSPPTTTVNILGRRWRLRYCRLQKNYGECDAPDKPNKEIRISSRIGGQHELEILLHEMLHAAGWHIDEEFVGRSAADMARVLYRLGYRRVLAGPAGGFGDSSGDYQEGG